MSFEPESAYVRGILVRVGNLMAHGRLDDAERAYALAEPFLTQEPRGGTHYAATWMRARLLRASLNTRRGGVARVEEARSIVSDLERRAPLRRSGGDALLRDSALLVFYSSLSITINRLGQHVRAADMAEQIAERSRANPSRRHLNLFDAAIRHDAEGFAQMCRDRRPRARAQLARAMAAIDESLQAGARHVPAGQQREGSLLARTSIKLRVRLHQLEIDRRDLRDGIEPPDQSPSDCVAWRADVEAVRVAANQLLDRSFENSTTTPTELANRHGCLGDAVLLQARALGPCEQRVGLAQIARIWLLPRWELGTLTGDGSAMLRLDYAEACALAGSTLDAVAVLKRMIRDLGERCGADYPPVVVARERLEELTRAQEIGQAD